MFPSGTGREPLPQRLLPTAGPGTKSTVTIIPSFQTSLLLHNLSLTAEPQLTWVINGKASTTRTATEENRLFGDPDTLQGAGAWTDDGLEPGDPHSACSIPRDLPPPQTTVSSPRRRRVRACGGASGARAGVYSLPVYRVLELSLSLAQRCSSTSRASSPKNVSVTLRCRISEGHLISPEWFARANFLSMKYLTIHGPPGL